MAFISSFIKECYLRFQGIRSIRWKLILSIGLPLLAIYSVILLVSYWSLRKAAYHNAETYLQEFVSRYAAKTNGEFFALASIAQSTASFLTANPGLPEAKLYEILERSVRQNPLVYGACLAFEPFSYDERRLFAPYVWRGKDAVSNGPNAKLLTMDVGRDAYDYLDWDWFTNAKKAMKPIWTEPFFDEGAGDIIMVTHTAPFFTADGKFRGTSNIDVHLAKMQEWGMVSAYKNARFSLISREGVFLSHPNPEYILKQTVFTLPEAQNRPDLAKIRDKVLSGKPGVDIAKNFPQKQTTFIVYAPIESTGWIFLAAVWESEIMEPVWKQLREFSMFMLLGLLIIIGILLVGSFKITDPLTSLAREVRRVASGTLEVDAACCYPNDEIGELAKTFHTMVGDLKRHINALTKETARRESVESELRVAREIQTSLLPRKFPPFPQYKEFDLHGLNVPARHVGGDFFDFFLISDNELAMVIADVSGKGVPAAMFMAVARTLVRNAAGSHQNPSGILTQVNRALIEDNTNGFFVTMMIVYYHIKTGAVRYANAGHQPCYVVGQNGQIRLLGEATGTVVGVSEESVYLDKKGKLDPGETLVFYTDGISEARRHKGEFFGAGRLEEILSANGRHTARQLCELILKHVDDFQGHELADDVTVMALKRNGTPSKIPVTQPL